MFITIYFSELKAKLNRSNRKSEMHSHSDVIFPVELSLEETVKQVSKFFCFPPLNALCYLHSLRFFLHFNENCERKRKIRKLDFFVPLPSINFIQKSIIYSKDDVNFKHSFYIRCWPLKSYSELLLKIHFRTIVNVFHKIKKVYKRADLRNVEIKKCETIFSHLQSVYLSYFIGCSIANKWNGDTFSWPCNKLYLLYTKKKKFQSNGRSFQMHLTRPIIFVITTIFILPKSSKLSKDN